jgi:hypothetical protein
MPLDKPGYGRRDATPEPKPAKPATASPRRTKPGVTAGKAAVALKAQAGKAPK